MSGSSRSLAGTWLLSLAAGRSPTMNFRMGVPGVSSVPVGPRPLTCSRRLTMNSSSPMLYLEKSMTISARLEGPNRTLFMVNGAGSRLPSLEMWAKSCSLPPCVK